MRYFKYKNENTIDVTSKNEKHADLLKREKRSIGRAGALNTIATVVFFSVTVFCFVASALAITRIPAPEYWFAVILYTVGIVILILMALVASIVIGGLVSSPIYSRANSDINTLKQKIRSETCAHLRDYYGVQEPCIVTKCYDSSDINFNKHDVCIFIADGELRITTNLKYGFFNEENDLGCYAFEKSEISVLKRQGEKFSIAELKSQDVTFHLGYRAKGFIDSYINSQ